MCGSDPMQCNVVVLQDIVWVNIALVTEEKVTQLGRHSQNRYHTVNHNVVTCADYTHVLEREAFCILL
jgi:hypothetical protein